MWIQSYYFNISLDAFQNAFLRKDWVIGILSNAAFHEISELLIVILNLKCFTSHKNFLVFLKIGGTASLISQFNLMTNNLMQNINTVSSTDHQNVCGLKMQASWCWTITRRNTEKGIPNLISLPWYTVALMGHSTTLYVWF